jgi:naphthalene 1,2-dioxygenase ferredoxin component
MNSSNDMADWTDVCEAAGVPDGDVVAGYAGGHEIALYRIGDEVFATDAMCTHGQARLCGGFVEEDGSIECPLHQGRFDIRTGRALCAPLEVDLVVHPVRLHDGRVWVRLRR